MKVPMKENIMTVPILRKNELFYMLYPDSNMIGGNKRIIKRLLKCFDIFFM